MEVKYGRSKKVKFIRIGFIVFISSWLIFASVLSGRAISYSDFTEDLDFPYRIYYDDSNRPFIAVFDYQSNNVNFGTLSPIGAAFLVNGDTQTYFRLPYGCVLAGMVIYNTYSQNRNFYSDPDWWDFFNSYIDSNDNMTAAYNSASLEVFPNLSLNTLKQIELQVCQSGYNRDCYLVFSDDSLDLIYHYAYYLLVGYGMFDIDWSYDQFYSDAFKLNAMIDLSYDISRNPVYYKDALFNIVTNIGSADYVPINNQFENYLVLSGYNPISAIFDLILNGKIFNWLPSVIVSMIITQITVLLSIVSFLYFKKIIGASS